MVQKKSHLQQDTVVRIRRRKRNHSSIDSSIDSSHDRDNTSNDSNARFEESFKHPQVDSSNHLHTEDTSHTHSTDNPGRNDYTAQLFAKLGHTLTPEHLVEALTHKSFTHEHEGAPSYERFEFLGDAVLELVVTETLFSQHPDFSEGQMAKIRAKAVSEEVLAPIARDFLQVGPMILLGNGEADDHGAEKDSILCDIVESLIGAVFIEHGIDAARETVHSLIDVSLERVSHEGPSLDWKTSLAKIAHELGINELTYRMEVGGPDYAQVFTAYAELAPNVTSDKLKIDTSKPLGSGQGSTKRKAQMIAAENAWKVLNELTVE